MIAPIEQREIKFTRKLLKMYGKGATIDECYQFCCSDPSLLTGVQCEYERRITPIRYLHVHTINHRLKLLFV